MGCGWVHCNSNVSTIMFDLGRTDVRFGKFLPLHLKRILSIDATLSALSAVNGCDVPRDRVGLCRVVHGNSNVQGFTVPAIQKSARPPQIILHLCQISVQGDHIGEQLHSIQIPTAIVLPHQELLLSRDLSRSCYPPSIFAFLALANPQVR